MKNDDIKKLPKNYDPDDIEIKVGETTMDWKNETPSQAMNRELERIKHENKNR